jgi:opacity protein-like surface antigen
MMSILHRTTRQGRIRYRTILAVAVVVGLLVGAGPVFAQIYITAGYLPTFTGDTDFEVGAKPSESGDFEANRAGSGIFDVGLLGLRAAAGYRLFVVRIEGEVSYRQLKLSDYEYASYRGYEDAFLESLNESIEVESGHLKALNLMVNVWFDIDIGGGFRPYLGGGVGGGQLTLGTTAKTDPFTSGAKQIPDTTQEFPDSSAWAFAYQVGGGVGFELVAGLTLSLGYRLSSTTTAELAWNAIDSGSDEILRSSTLHHSIDLGLRYEFF